MSDPECCSAAMWLQSVEEVEDRGGSVLLPFFDEDVEISDALIWECMDCGAVRVIAVLAYGFPGPLGQDGAA